MRHRRRSALLHRREVGERAHRAAELVVISVFKEQALCRVDTQLIPREGERDRAAAAGAEFEIPAAPAFLVNLGKMPHRGADLGEISSAPQQRRKSICLDIAQNVPVRLVIARHLHIWAIPTRCCKWQRRTLTRESTSGSRRSRTPSSSPIRQTPMRACCAPTRWSSSAIRQSPARGAMNT